MRTLALLQESRHHRHSTRQKYNGETRENLELFSHVLRYSTFNLSVICLNEMVKYNEQEENDPHDVAEHGQLDVADHVGSGAESAV